MKILIALILLGMVLALPGYCRPTELHLFDLIRGGDYSEIDYALQELPRYYGTNTEALEFVRSLLDTNETVVCTRPLIQPNRSTVRIPVRHALLICSLARSLGDFHATLTGNELSIIYTLFDTRIENDAMDALKGLRGMNNPECVPVIIPLLQNYSPHVARDAIRTLAVHGNRSVIPKIEPLTKDMRVDVREDALQAIKELQQKP
jgi:hypothetical protein